MNVVVTRDVQRLGLPEGVLGVAGVEEGLRRLRGMDTEGGEGDEMSLRPGEAVRLGRVFVIGGAEIYKCALEMGCCERVLWTRVRGEWECDVGFPEGVLPVGVGEGEGDESGEKRGWVRRSMEDMERWVGEQGIGGLKREGEVEFEVCMLEKEGVGRERLSETSWHVRD